MHAFSPFEILMLLCFGAAWPFSIYKSYKSRKNAGKSVVFLAIVLAGYVAGVLHKSIYNMDYILNGVMVLVDMGLYFRNYRLGK